MDGPSEIPRRSLRCRPLGGLSEVPLRSPAVPQRSLTGQPPPPPGRQRSGDPEHLCLLEDFLDAYD
eukprot:10677209-Alexandrium_andersonii.AAC.1